MHGRPCWPPRLGIVCSRCARWVGLTGKATANGDAGRHLVCCRVCCALPERCKTHKPAHGRMVWPIFPQNSAATFARRGSVDGLASHCASRGHEDDELSVGPMNLRHPVRDPGTEAQRVPIDEDTFGVALLPRRKGIQPSRFGHCAPFSGHLTHAIGVSLFELPTHFSHISRSAGPPVVGLINSLHRALLAGVEDQCGAVLHA